jgi:hypothetical protein
LPSNRRRGSAKDPAARQLLNWRFLCYVKPVTALAVFDLDDPKIGIESHLARQPFFDFGGLDPLVLMGARPKALHPMFGKLRLGRRRKKGCAAVEPIDLDEYGPRLSGAAPPQCRDCAFDRASPEIGRNPDVGAKPHENQWAAALAAALSCLTSLALISFDGASPCDRSNCWTACSVEAPTTPSALIAKPSLMSAV